MNLLRELRLFAANLFGGLSKADSVIMGQNAGNNDKVMPVHQVKDNQRVAHSLLKGEETQAVKELRYRDYLVSERSRSYSVHGDEAMKTSRISYTANYFGGLNHSLCLGIDDPDNKEEYTLKIEYNDVPRFNLSKYCTQFYVDLVNKNISLYFNLLPNKNITTNKAFLNYINQSMFSFKLGGEFSELKKIWFVSYKISSLQNYLKFTFNDLILNQIDHTDKDLILKYTFKDYEIEDLIGKYKVDELDEKYKNKDPKHLPTTDIEYEILSKCEVCGKTITETEAAISDEICGKHCCSECIFIEMGNNLNKEK